MLILLRTQIVLLVVKQICDRKQLIKVEAVTQSYLWALSESIRDSLVKQIVTRGRQLTEVVLWAAALGTGDVLLLPFPGLGMKAQFQGFLSQIVETIQRISRPVLLPCQRGVSCDVGTPGTLLDKAQDAKLVGETHLPPPPCLGLLSILPELTHVGDKGLTG